MPPFRDRIDAAKRLVERLKAYEGTEAVVFALPRGGVVLGVEVAKALKLPLDLVIARKVGARGNDEYAIACVAEDGDAVVTAEAQHEDEAWFEAAKKKGMAEARRRREAYLGSRARPDVAGKTAIVVDDGIATGLTMRCVLKEIAHRKPARVVVAVPVAPADAVEALRKEVDEVVVLTDLSLGAIGAAYERFDQVSDEEVKKIMRDAV